MPNDESSASASLPEEKLLDGFKHVLDLHAGEDLEAALSNLLTRFLVLSMADDAPPELVPAIYQVVMDDLLLALALLNQRDSPFMARALAASAQVILADMRELRALRAQRPDLSSDAIVELVASMRRSDPNAPKDGL